MSTYIYNEIWLFIRAFAGGAVLILCYSLLQEIRRLIFCSPAAGGILDLLYWVCAGLLVFAGIYRINQGILRSFLFLGIISGAFLTYLTKKYINWLLFFCKRCKILVKQSANQYKNSTRNHLQMRRGRKLGKIREKTKKKDNRV